MSDERYDKQIGFLKENSPKLKSKAELRDRVLGEIGARESNLRLKMRLGWAINVAASIFIFLSIGFYVWLEGDTYLQRTLLIGKIEHENTLLKPAEQYCQESLREMLTSIEASGAVIFDDDNTLLLTQSDVALLKKSKSPYWPQIENFIRTLEKYYPKSYQQYLAEGGVRLSIWQLKNDHRICELF